MNTPFTPPNTGFGFGPGGFGPGGFGPGGFGPGGRGPGGRRHARREFRDQIREQATGQQGPFGPGFGPGFGRGFGPGFGGPGPGAGFGPGGRGRGGRGRGKRGDVRAAILTLLTERPMHGYEMTQEIAARSNDLWKPSPGSVYPTLQLLVDEDLITPTASEGSKKTFELTEEGRTAAGKIATAPWDEIAEDADPNAVNLRAALGQLFGAVGQAAHAATGDQQQRILDIVNNARREIYQILGEE